MTPTPTPDPRLWALAWLALTAASGTALASHVHVRWLDARGVRMVPVHLSVLAVTAGCGLLLLGPGWLWEDEAWRGGPGGGPGGAARGRGGGGRGGPGAWPGGAAVWRAGLAAGAGLLLGYAVIRADAWITRTTAARRPAPRRGPAAGDGAAPARLRPVGLGGTVTPLRSADHAGADRRWTPTRRDTDLNLALSWLLATAVAEECVFRGVLLRLAVLPGTPAAQVLGVAGAVAAFALSHMFFGWHQVLAKLPLSVLATAATLTFGTILPAAVGHALFNWHVWRNRPVVAEQGVPR